VLYRENFADSSNNLYTCIGVFLRIMPKILKNGMHMRDIFKSFFSKVDLLFCFCD
jgi:hypothetical protein